MPRQSRNDVSGEVYHVINRANARISIFESGGDFDAVIASLEETLKMIPLEIFSFCIMSNHWHFAVRSRFDGDLGRFFGKFTQKFTQRWHKYHQTVGSGHLFQGRFKSFLVQTDSYFIQLMKYIEANPLRAGMVPKAEEWKWGSLYLRINNVGMANDILKPWPVGMPNDYLLSVNEPLRKVFLDQVRNSVVRGRPLGTMEWVQKKVDDYGLESTIREPHRPKLK
jgi:putative transposase